VAERLTCALALPNADERSMAKKRKPPFLAVELPDEDAARELAKKLAKKTGHKVTVTDEDGREVARIPKPPKTSK